MVYTSEKKSFFAVFFQNYMFPLGLVTPPPFFKAAYCSILDDLSCSFKYLVSVRAAGGRNPLGRMFKID